VFLGDGLHLRGGSVLCRSGENPENYDQFDRILDDNQHGERESRAKGREHKFLKSYCDRGNG